MNNIPSEDREEQDGGLEDDKKDQSEMPKNVSPKQTKCLTDLRKKIIDECEAMVAYALSSGTEIPRELVEQFKSCVKEFSDECCANLVDVHNKLAALVSPARPDTLSLMRAKKGRSYWSSVISQISIVRWMIIIAAISLAVFIVTSSSSTISGGAIKNVIFEPLMKYLYWVASAALGASFIALFQLNDFINRSTYDPKYESSYWIRFSLGILSGVILAEVFSPYMSSENAGKFQFGLAIVAMVGGFSTTVVYRVLKRIVSSVEMIFIGDTQEQIENKVKEEKAKMEKEALVRKSELLNMLNTLKGQVGNQPNANSAIDAAIKKL